VGGGAGAYVLNGQDANLIYGHAGATLVAGSGSFALTGSAASLRVGRKIAAGTGSYVLDGLSAGLRTSRRLIGDSGAYLLTGMPVDLVYEGTTTDCVISGTFRRVDNTPLANHRRALMVVSGGSRVAISTDAAGVARFTAPKGSIVYVAADVPGLNSNGARGVALTVPNAPAANLEDLI